MASFDENSHMSNNNRQIIFAKRPEGAPTEDVFSLVESEIPQPGDGKFVVRNHYISMDPALVSRMREEDNYAESTTPGEVMHAYCVGEVVASNWDGAQIGEMRFGRFDMQEYALVGTADPGMVIDTSLAPASWYLGVIGTTGATAYLAFNDICDPKDGETVVISSAGSSVGTVVAQLARESGCRVVGIVSTDEKAARVREDWGYDAVISYRGKTVDELAANLSEVCPEGVDVYYDNTSGDISEALLDLYNIGARIAVIGRMGISHLSDTRLDVGRRDNNVILSKRIRKEGWVLLDHTERMLEALMALAGLIREGKLQVKEDVMEGIENAPAAFFRMLRGENDGKQLVKLFNENTGE
jgi:NADPH-dependent curcumin reductase CurA